MRRSEYPIFCGGKGVTVWECATVGNAVVIYALPVVKIKQGVFVGLLFSESDDLCQAKSAAGPLVDVPDLSMDFVRMGKGTGRSTLVALDLSIIARGLLVCI